MIDLFPKAGLGYGPLTAVCVALRCIPKENISDGDWQSITKKVLNIFFKILNPS